MKKKIILASITLAILAIAILCLWLKFNWFPSERHQFVGPKKFALLVGIKDGNTTWAETDVGLASKLLKVENDSFNTFISTDRDSCKKANILRHLYDFAGRAQAGDLVYIYFTCHGTQVEDINLDEGKVTAGDTKDEVMLLYDNEMLLDDEMDKVFSSFNTGVQIVFIADCCHSGTLLSMAATPKFDMMPNDPFNLKAEIIYMGACMDAKLAKTSPSNTYSKFTGVLWKIGSENVNGNYFKVLTQVRKEIEEFQRPSYIEMSSKGVCVDQTSRCNVINQSFKKQIAFQ